MASATPASARPKATAFAAWERRCRSVWSAAPTCGRCASCCSSTRPFAALESIKGALPTGPARREAAAKGPAKAVVRMERVGRGGKEVTVIEQLELKVEERETWLKALKAALGCGGSIEGTSLVLQ